MRKIYVDSCALQTETGEPCSLDYYLLVDEMEAGRFLCESYGVGVVRRETGEQKLAAHVTTSAERIDHLLGLLVRGQVTPCTLMDVLEDWL